MRRSPKIAVIRPDYPHTWPVATDNAQLAAVPHATEFLRVSMDGDIDAEAWQCLECLTRLRGLWLDLSGGGDAPRPFPARITELTWLRTLHVSGCANTRTLPAAIEQLEGLEELELSGWGLEEAEAVVQLPKLRKLGLPDCRSLAALPASLGDLPLQQLDLSGCRALAALPDSFGHLTGLERLDLSGCRSLAALPDSFGQLSGLQMLDLSDCRTLDLPASVRKKGVSKQLVLASEEDCRAAIHDVTHHQAQRGVVRKLATQQETMLVTLERMSWLMVLLATATFMAFFSPPGGFSDSKQVLVGTWDACKLDGSATNATNPGEVALPHAYQDCSLYFFFLFDTLSFSFSLGCMMLIVVLSMPRMQYDDDNAEAGRFWLLLLSTWLVLYLAVAFGFAAFAASAVAMFDNWWALIAPLLPGAVLLVLGYLLMWIRFWQLYPGWPAVWLGVKSALVWGCCREFCCGRCCHPLPLRQVQPDVEMGQLVMSNRFWGRAEQALDSALSRSMLAAPAVQAVSRQTSGAHAFQQHIAPTGVARGLPGDESQRLLNGV